MGIFDLDAGVKDRGEGGGGGGKAYLGLGCTSWASELGFLRAEAWEFGI